MEIFAVEATPGMIGISAMPGLSGDLDADVAAIADWGAALVLTMTAEGEMERMGLHGLGSLLSARGIGWRHLPIADFGAPPAAVQAIWPDASAAARDILDGSGRVLTHCRAGCGRSGMAALRLLVERGEAPGAALNRIRDVRSCAVETQAQFAWAAEGASQA